ncbi:MAG: DUF4093 domain-containing protein [Clostridia bacterium]|nr:DUF4093 domain-containing protein [Clostridia bacterium]
MLRIKEVIIVEGNYDKSKLASLVDATIVVTDGFLIFKDKKKCDMIKALAKENGAIIFTDSDSAGFKIRNYLKNILADCKVRHAYIPDIKGKEKRKNHHSKEGFLGVEGVSDSVILKALENAGFELAIDSDVKKITKSDFFADGLTGSGDSALKREVLKKKLNLPKHLSANMLLDVLNKLYGYDEYKKILSAIDNDKKM